MNMEPTTSAGAGLVGWKLLAWAFAAGGVAAGLATIVVMCVTTPRTPKEWAVALISTLVSSLSLGSGMALWLGLHQHLASHSAPDVILGLIAIGGVLFACGLPGWALVRAVFTTIRKREGQGIDQIAQEIRGAKGGEA